MIRGNRAMRLLIVFFCILMFTTVAFPNLFAQDNNDPINCGSCFYTPGTYLIETLWGQRRHYNDLCPMNCQPGADCFQERLGCWSVAIGQIINHHNEYYNLQSEGIAHYWCTENFIIPKHIVNNLDEHDYDWSKMVNELKDTSSPAEKDNVSRLLYDTATVIQKDFGTDGYCTIITTSDLTDLINELIDHFDDITAFTDWDNDLTESEIKNEIDYGRPIMFYTRGHNITTSDSFGHAMVIDGYRYNTSGERVKFEVHINYGWYGTTDGWYYYYGNLPTYDPNMLFDEPSFRKGLLIRLAPSPPSLAGPSNGAPGFNYNFTASTVYDVNPPLYYKFDWGDGTYTEWLGRYESGEPCTVSHAWKEKGTYNVKVKARDVDNWESDWSDPLPVRMPKFKFYDFPLISRFIMNHPLILQVLKYINENLLI